MAINILGVLYQTQKKYDQSAHSNTALHRFQPDNRVFSVLYHNHSNLPYNQIYSLVQNGSFPSE